MAALTSRIPTIQSLRQHGQVQGELLGQAKRTGTTRSGPVYEQAMLVRDPASGETMRVRRITIKLKVPTRSIRPFLRFSQLLLITRKHLVKGSVVLGTA